MAFDIFSMPQGPAVPVNLFAENTTAGINAGNAAPTAISSAIQGVQQGIKAGQQFVENNQQIEIRQHQIDQFPIEDQIKASQLKHQQIQEQLDTLKIEAALANQEAILQSEKLKAENVLAEQRQLRDDFSTFDIIKKSLSSSDPLERKNILINPQFTGFLSRNHDQASSIIGTLASRGDINESEAIKAYSIVDFYKSQALKNEAGKSTSKIEAQLSKEFDAAVAKLSEPTIRYAIKDLKADTIVNDVEIYPKGLKQTDPKTKKLLPGVADNEVSLDDSKYDMFIGGVLQPHTLNEAQATAITNVQDIARRKSKGQTATEDFLTRQGSLASDKASAETSVATAQEPQVNQPPNFTNAITSAVKAGVREEDAASILNQAAEEGSRANIIQRSLVKYLPLSLQYNPIVNSAVNNLEESSKNVEARQAINVAAGTLTNSTLETLNTGSTTEKDQIRLWAKTNGVPLTYSGLKNYYESSVRDSLNKSYVEAYQAGIAEADKKASQQSAQLAIQENANKLYQGKSPQEAIKLGEQSAKAAAEVVPSPASAEVAADAAALPAPAEAPTEIPTPSDIKLSGVSLENRAKQVANDKGLSPKQTAAVQATVKEVSFNPLLDNQVPHVKALAAVESGGVNRAKSSTNVVGPMQVTQGVADRYTKALGVRFDKNDPEQNVQLGKMYIDDLIADFNGVKELAYAAYNAGPAAVAYAQKLAGGSSEWKEVKKFLLPALEKYKHSYPQGVMAKLSEVFNYPEKVALYEEIFA